MRHIYIHVPFCSRRCVYCDFSIAVRREVPGRHYLNSIVEEYENRKSAGEWDDSPLETLYLGGGTPSTLPAACLTELLRFFLHAEPSTGTRTEVTVEANPENVTHENARAWVGAGVNRVSVGAQSFDPRVLEWMHRTHSPDQIGTAVRILREAGIESVSLDLIAALPTDLDRDFRDDLAKTLALQPDHVSVYGLTVEPRTALSRWIIRGVVPQPTDEAFNREFLLAHDVMRKAGMDHYEVSNYARAGSRSRHNSAYWDGSPYAGLGPSAHGFDGAERRWNVRPWAEYDRLIATCGDATGGRETLNSDQKILERTYLGLRTSDGLSEEEMARLDHELVVRVEESGWAESVRDRWRLTPSGWLRLDEIAAALTTSPEGG